MKNQILTDFQSYNWSKSDCYIRNVHKIDVDSVLYE